MTTNWQSQNQKSGIHGIHWSWCHQRWMIRLYFGSEYHYIGSYTDLEDAKVDHGIWKAKFQEDYIKAAHELAQVKLARSSSTGYRNVIKKGECKYIVKCRHNKKNVHIGTFSSIPLAVKARDAFLESKNGS